MTDDANRVVLLLAMLGNLLFGVGWTIADFWTAAERLWRRVACFPPLVLGVALVLHVAGEDSYRHDGTSRWQAYDAGLVTSVTVAVAAGTAVAGYVARGRENLAPLAAFGCGLSGVLTYVTLVLMSN